ncbi:hypothetical protein FACS189497_07030 [Betaproteobacteria bacterium]|nr:hypothetical protein FACS189488_04530 [Betaproteobacteria bacterium]GHU29303.1 hypothetical protein FACS189497_07030 [Betaproteobacteria bacterium]
MPSCILRVSGSTTKVRKFLASSSIEPLRVFWKGEPRNPKSRVLIKTSGFNIELATAEGLEAQSKKAVRFIRKRKDDLLLIKSLGFSSISIDFCLYDMTTEDRPWPSYCLPRSLVQSAAELGCEIKLSSYGIPPEAP